MASPLGSFNLSRKREEEDEEKMIGGFLTMEEFKGRDFNDEFHRSLSSVDRLCEVLSVRIRKNEREKQLNDDIAGKRIKPSIPTEVASSSCSNAAPFQLPGLLPQGKYFNLGFDHKNQHKNEIRQPGFNFNWALQRHPKKPRSTSNFRQIPATATAAHEYVDLKSNPDLKLKRKYHGDEDWAASKKKKTKKNVYIKNNKTSSLCPPPDLPEEYKKLIIGKMNGTELTLLIQKELYPTDVNPNHNRLSLPPLQVWSGSFLTPNEFETLNQKHSQKNRDLGFLKIPFIDPRLKLKEKKGINLSLWTLSNSERKSYVLKTSWSKVVKKNKLVAGDVIQVWSFRANGNQLHLAIVLVQRAAESSNQSGGSSHVVDGDHEIEWGGRSKGVEGSTSASSDGVVDTNSDHSFVTQEGRRWL